jgi:mRNA interferase HigB
VCKEHADCCEALDDWYGIEKIANWRNLLEVQTVYPQAEAVSNFTILKSINIV